MLLTHGSGGLGSAEMIALAPHMGETKFARWTVKGSELPLSWDDALRRLKVK